MADSDGVVMVRWRRNWSVSKIGLPEVDTIMDGDRFRNFPVFSLAASKSAQVRNKITDTRRRRTLARCKVSNDNVDHISRLPDALLQFIISLLTMREAAATTILSTRWRSLWTSSFSCLEFDIPNMLGYDYPNIMFENESQGYLMEKRSNFTTWVNQVMQLCLAQRLDALRVSFILDRHSASHIDKWIMSAVAQGATDIFLDFHYERFYGRLHDPHELYQFPTQDFVSKLKYLQLKSCKLHLEPSFTGFTSLITLSLTAVHISQSLMENILSKCPLLEFLTLNNCYHPSSTNFKFAGPSLRLKHLRIGNNYDITKIELHGINLLSFELGISKASVSIKDTPHLTRLVLLTRLKPVEILSNTPRLETLFLHQKVEGNGVVSQFDIFKNLRRLVFIPHCDTTNLLGVVRILSACLLLEKLELDMGISEESSTINGNSMIVEQLTALPEISLENLKEIEIYGFQAYPEKIELAKYLLKNAIVLQKMDIYTMTRMYCGNGRWRHRDDTSKMHSMILREEVHRLYQNAAHSSAKVRLFSSAN